MKFFVDTADINEIKKINETGMLDGVTTNPSIIAKSGKNFLEVIKEISTILDDRPVSAECVSLDYSTMMKEAEKLLTLGNNITIKVPLTVDGLKACKELSDNGVDVNVTLCFSANQALLAGKAGARYISPFVGRHDDWGIDGMDLIADICNVYDNYDFPTEVLVASARHPQHLLSSAKIGADVITIPPKVFYQLYQHPYTDLGLNAFEKDWTETGQSIL